MRMKLVSVVFAALALPASALAQTSDNERGPSKGDWEITLSGSGTSNNDFDGHVFGASGSVGNYVSENVLLGVRQSVSFADIENSDDQFAGATRGFVDYVFNLGAFRPYVGFSLGGIYGGENVNDTFAAGPEAGLKYYADNNTFIFIQSEYQWAFDQARDVDDAAGDGQFYHLLGIGFNF